MSDLSLLLETRHAWTVDVFDAGRWGFIGSRSSVKALLDLVAAVPAELPVRVSLGSRGAPLAKAYLDGRILSNRNRS